MRKFIIALVLAVSTTLLATGCTRISSGEVGVRVNVSNEVQGSELMPGSWNQTIVGNVLTFPVKEIAVSLDNKTPMTSDNTALADFDITVVYAINPSSVAELYMTKSKSFHGYDDKEKDVLLMQQRILTHVNNASYKAVREYNALEVADKRKSIETKIIETVTENLKEDKVASSISITDIKIRNILPNAEILAAATQYVRSQNELKIKETEVKIAQKEAERMAALSSNSGASIAYMNAQSQQMLAQAALAGKVQTILIPHGMTMFAQGK